MNEDARRTIEFAKVAAKINDGLFVELTTRRGQKVQGTMHNVGEASCCVGVAGRFAYGGIIDIRQVEEVK